MKKFLLGVATMMVAVGAYAQDGIDITPSQYKYNDRAVGQETIQKFYTGANPDYSVLRNTIVEGYNNGYLFVAGGQFGNTKQTYATDLQAGTSIVDLGGEAGKVLCVNGVNSKFNDTYSMDYPKCTGGLNWFNFDWCTDPENTPTGGSATAPNIRVSVVVNIYSNSPSAANAVINKAYVQSCQNGVLPTGSNSDSDVEVYSGDFVETYDDGEPVLDDDENMIYDPTKWMVYEWDTYCPEADKNDDGTTASVNVYAPIRVKMEMNAGNLASSTMFIKEVKFTKLEDNSDPIIGKRVKTFKTYKVDPQKVATAIAGTAADNTNAPKQVYTIDGKRVNANSLAKGIYVVKQGTKTAKYVVK